MVKIRGLSFMENTTPQQEESLIIKEESLIIKEIKFKRVASFTGGGALSFIEMGIFQHIVTENPDIKFDIFCGVSGGSMVALILSHFADDYIEGINYIKSKNFTTSSVFSLSLFPFPRTGLLNTEPLRKTLTKVFIELDKRRVNGVQPKKTPCYVAITSLNSGLIEYFDIHSLPSIKLKVEVIMASSAIPGIFPIVPITGLNGDNKTQCYQDGGIVSNDLLSQIFNICGDVTLDIYYFSYKNPYLKYCDNYKYNNIFGFFTSILRTFEIVLMTFNSHISKLGSIQNNLYNDTKNIKPHSKPVSLFLIYGTVPVNFFMDALNINNYIQLIEQGLNNNNHTIVYDISMF